MEYSFDQLPKAVSELNTKLDCILELLLNHSSKAEQVKDEILNVEEAATFLKLKVKTIYDKVYKKELPVYKKGKYLYFYKDELHNYITSGRQLSQADLQRDAENFLKKRKRRPVY